MNVTLPLTGDRLLVTQLIVIDRTYYSLLNCHRSPAWSRLSLSTQPLRLDAPFGVSDIDKGVTSICTTWLDMTDTVHRIGTVDGGWTKVSGSIKINYRTSETS